MGKYTVGVDVGGTNIKFGLLNAQGKIIARKRLATEAFVRNKEKLIKAMVEAIQELWIDQDITTKNIEGVGFGFPGLINYKEGVVNSLTNIFGWKNVPIKKILEKELKVPVFIDNDVNVVGLGEWKYGVGQGVENLIYITLGTGVGGALILNNALYRGEGSVAGEIGHMPLNERGEDCNCGGFGCFERSVGNIYIVEKARKLFRNKALQLEDVFDLANQGNTRAIEFWDDMATHIGNALVGVVNLLNPRLIVLGGGVSNNYKFLHKTITKIIQQRSMAVQKKMVKIARAKLGDDAGIIGAHVLIKESIIGLKKKS